MKKLIIELITRWKSESPLFWKKFYNLMFTIGGSAFGIILMDKIVDLKTLGVPDIIFTICGYVLTICGAMGLTAKLT